MNRTLTIASACLVGCAVSLTLAPAAVAETGDRGELREPRDRRRGAAERAEAQQRFRRGTQLFRQGEYEAALAEFLRAQELSPHPLTLYNIANCYARLNRYAEAIERFEQVLREHGRALGAQRIGHCRRELERLRSLMATVTLVVDVPVAELWLDGESVGEIRGEREMSLAAGTHVIEVRAPDHQTLRREVTVAGGMVSRLEFELPRQAVLRVDSDVTGAEVLIDGRRLGNTPYEGEMPLGEHRIRVEHSDHAPWEAEVEGHGGRTVRVEVDLAPLEPRMSPVWFWLDLGVTLALGTVAIAMGGAALAREDDYEAVVDQIAAGGLDAAELWELREQGAALREEIDRYALVCDVMIGLTSAFAIGALVLGLVSDIGEPRSRGRVRLSSAPPGGGGRNGGMALAWRF